MDIRESITELANEAFAHIEKIQSEYFSASQNIKGKPLDVHLANDKKIEAEVLQSKANYITAKNNYDSMMRTYPDQIRGRMAELRREYAKEVEKQFEIDPKSVDKASLELLKSGIMKPNEYSDMLKKAASNNNVTMVRLVAKYAEEASAEAEKKYGETSPQARELRAVGYSGNIDPAGEALKTFDNVTEILYRCTNNPYMISHWEELAYPLIEML